jgi:hypothetical protein
VGQCDLASRHRQRLRCHLLSRLVCLGRHSITGLLTTAGRQFVDWTGDYRFYARRRAEPQSLFAGLRRHIVGDHPSGPLVVSVDDTRTEHTGRKIPGAKYTRDPLGPSFHVNFIRANRFVQLSMAYPTGAGRARMIPIDFVHAPTADKPPRKATAAQIAAYHDQQRRRKLGCVAAERLRRLREQVDSDQHQERSLWAVGDGGYTNRTVLRSLPERMVFIGRIRSDAKLYALPEVNPTGRRRVYGAELPTPEAIRQDPSIPWQEVTAVACGREHAFRIKTLDAVRWRPSGKQDLRLIVIAPLRYRLSSQHRLLYRKPGYLICTDPAAPLQQVLQAYLWRWDIEVNFRDEKSLLGIGEAKVRHPASVENVPAMGVAAYGLLLLAGLHASRNGHLPDTIAPPKWRRGTPKRLCVTQLISLLRHELWHDALRKHHFVSEANRNITNQKRLPDLESALFYAIKSG